MSAPDIARDLSGLAGIALGVVLIVLLARLIRPWRARRVLRHTAPTRDVAALAPAVRVLSADDGRCALCGWAAPSLDRDPYDGLWYCQGGCPDDERDEFPVDAAYAEPTPADMAASRAAFDAKYGDLFADEPAAAPAPAQVYRSGEGLLWEDDPARPGSVRVHGHDGLWWPRDEIARLFGLTPIDTPEDPA